MDNAFAYLEKNGAELESVYPYTAQDGTCAFDAKNAKVTVKSFVDVEQTDAGLKAAIAEGPVSVAVAAND